MEIKKIAAIPQMDRDEEAGSYVYPEEYQNTLCEYQGQYLYFKVNSYDSFPKTILDAIVEARLSDLDLSMPELPTEEQIEEIVQNKLNDFQSNLNLDQPQINEADIVANATSNVLDQITNKIETMVNNKVDEIINNFNARFEQFDNRMKEDFATFDDIGELSVNVEQKLEAFSKSVSIDTSKVKEVVNGELQIVKDNMQEVIETTVNEILKEKDLERRRDLKEETVNNSMLDVDPSNVITSKIASEKTDKSHQHAGIVGQSNTDKVSLGTLISLKEGGFDVDEISHLRNLGLV